MSNSIQHAEKIQSEKEFHTEKKEYSIFKLFLLAKIKNIRIEFHYEDISYQGVVLDVTKYEVILNIFNLSIQSTRKIIFFFENFNTFYKVEGSIFSFERNQVTIKMPQEIYYLDKRKHIRVSFLDLFANFSLMPSKLYADKNTNILIDSDFSFLLKTIFKEQSIVKNLLKIILSEFSKMNLHVHLYTAKDKPQFHEVFDYIFHNTKKSIYVDNVNKIESFTHEINSNTLTNFYYFINSLSKDKNQVELSDTISNIKKNKLSLFYTSFLVAPIILFDEIIGYIQVYNTQLESFKISYKTACVSHYLIELFSYGISKRAIDYIYFNNQRNMARVLNLSLDGILLEIYHKKVFNYLQIHRRIRLQLNLFFNRIEIFGEILRFNIVDNRYFLGITIFKASKDDLQILEEFLYDSFNHSYF